MDQDAHYGLLTGSAALIAAWHTFLDRPMTEEQVLTMYRGKPHVLLMDANSAMQWAAQRLQKMEEQIRGFTLAAGARRGLVPGTADLN